MGYHHPTQDLNDRGSMNYIRTSIMFFFLLTSVAFAEGDSWLFRVKSINEIRAGRFILTLSPLKSGKLFPLNCKTVVVHVQYDSTRWKLYGGKQITKSKHDKAISLIKKAYKDQRPIKIGSMGEGFGFLDDQFPCEVQSRALSIIEQNGTEEIYSFYKWP
jgi:hypothetical protein